jgi:hypothetical protein
LADGVAIVDRYLRHGYRKILTFGFAVPPGAGKAVNRRKKSGFAVACPIWIGPESDRDFRHRRGLQPRVCSSIDWFGTPVREGSVHRAVIVAPELTIVAWPCNVLPGDEAMRDHCLTSVDQQGTDS